MEHGHQRLEHYYYNYNCYPETFTGGQNTLSQVAQCTIFVMWGGGGVTFIEAICFLFCLVFWVVFFFKLQGKKKINKLHINLLLFFPTGKKRLTFPHFSVRSFSFYSSHYLFNTLFLSEVPRSSSWFHISVSALFSRLKGFKGHHTTEHQTMKRSKETNRNLTWLRGPCLLGSSTHWKTH